MISGEISYVCLSITLHNINIPLLETNWESHCALIRLTACCLQEKNASPWRFLLCVNVTTFADQYIRHTHPPKISGYPSLFPCPVPHTRLQSTNALTLELKSITHAHHERERGRYYQPPRLISGVTSKLCTWCYTNVRWQYPETAQCLFAHIGLKVKSV